MVYLRVCLLLLLICVIHHQSCARSTKRHDRTHSKFKLIEVDLDDRSRSRFTNDVDQSLLAEVECGRGNWSESNVVNRYKQDYGEPRIAGGFQAKSGWFPSFVGLNIVKGTNLIRCGATLIDSRTALTAGHCVEGALIVLASGELAFPRASQLTIKGRVVKRACIAKGFNGNVAVIKNDFAVLIFKDAMEFNAERQPACLPKRAIEPDEKLIAVGLGRLGSGASAQSLQGIKLKPTKCIGYSRPEFSCLTKRTAGGGNVCRGDSGSGVYSVRNGKQYLTAIVSHGPDSCSSNQVATSKFLDIFKVNNQLDLLIKKCKEAG